MRPIFQTILIAVGLTAAVSAQSWTATSPLNQARHSACAVTLGDGRILVSGGIGADGAPLASAELYLTDGTFGPAPAMIAARSRHACVLLEDGRALLVGGDPNGTAELYDPVANAWQTVDGTGEPRSSAVATLLRDRRVLISGGGLASLEIYNPQENSLKPLAATLSATRENHAAVRLPDGSVLLIGGGNASTDRYSQLDDSVTPGPALNVARARHSATLLLDGTILVAGGTDGTQDLDSVELYDPATGAFRMLDAKLNSARRDHLALFLNGNGGVLLAGGLQADQALATTELYDPIAGVFQRLGDLTLPRTALAGAAVSDGVILATGGLNADGPQTACGLLLVPSISFNKMFFHPGDQVQVSGVNFRPGSRVTFNLDFVTANVPTLTNSRLLTPNVVTPAPPLQLFTGFAFTPITNTIPADAGKTVLVFAQTTDGTTLQASAPIRNATNITISKTDGIYQGRSTTFGTALTRPPTSTGPFTGLFIINAVQVPNCAGDGASNTVLVGESVGSNNGAVLGSLASVSSTLSGVQNTALLTGTIASLPTISVQLTSTYAGDAANDRAVATACIQSVSRTPTITFNPPATGQVGTPITLNATVNAQAGTPATALSGGVTFLLDEFAIGDRTGTPASIITAMTASRQFTPLTPGNFQLTAQYGGDSFFSSASSSGALLTVAKAPTTLALLSPPTTFHCDAPYSANVQLNFPATVGLTNRTVGLQVRLTDGSVPTVSAAATNSVTIGAGGTATATITIPSLKSNTASVFAIYGGDALLQPSQTLAVPLALQQSAVTVELTNVQDARPNPVQFNVKLTPQGCSTAVTGTLEILDGGLPVTVIPVSGSLVNGAISVPVSISRPPGVRAIQVRYSGDRLYTAASSATVLMTFQ